jgi:hypothetical protein
MALLGFSTLQRPGFGIPPGLSSGRFGLPANRPGVLLFSFQQDGLAAVGLRYGPETFTELANTAQLEHERSAGKDRYCSNEIWIWYLKPHLCALVGWGSRHPKPLMCRQRCRARPTAANCVRFATVK